MRALGPLAAILSFTLGVAGCASGETPIADSAIAERPNGASGGDTSNLDPDSVAVILPAGDPAAGRQAFLDHDCGSCHRVACDPDFQSRGSSGAPELDAARLKAQGFGTVASSIIAPSHRLAETLTDPESVDPESAITTEMPLFNEQLTVSEWINLVHFLVAEGDCSVGLIR